MKKSIVFALFLLTLASAAMAQQPQMAQDSQAQFASLLASNISQLLSNIDVMKKQLASLQDENEHLKQDAAKHAPPSGAAASSTPAPAGK